MSPCVDLGGGATICRPARIVELSRHPDRVRWCFACRKHLPHDVVVTGEPPEVETYYDPNVRYDCSRCHRDRTSFPGCDRSWDW